MEIQKNTIDFHINKPTAVTLGKFDGFHLGHQHLLRKVLEKKSIGLESLVFHFEFPGKACLMLSQEREELLQEKGVDHLISCPFVPEISHMEPEEFVKTVLIKQLNMKHLVVGADFCFGYHRKGNAKLLQDLSQEYGFTIDVVEKDCYNGKEISSTYVKEALQQGNMKLVNTLLGYDYYATGEVLHGKKIGRTLGMPTANLIVREEKLLPPMGVYASKIQMGNRSFKGVTNIGYKPTIEGIHEKGIETYLFDFEGDIYGEKIRVELLEFERSEKKFNSLQELKETIEEDVKWGRGYFGVS